MLDIPIHRLIDHLKKQNLFEEGYISASCQGMHVRAVSIDTRSVMPGDSYLALKGQKYDGHTYVMTAVQTGISLLIVSSLTAETREAAMRQDIAIIVVNDTLKAYQQIAALWRQMLKKTRVIAITGSNGKTSTKDTLSQILQSKYHVISTAKNENNEIGVPKTILNASPDTEYLILEYGMRGLGQIAELAEIGSADYALITNIGTSHISILGSREAIASAKAEIYTTQKRPIHVFLPIQDQKILSPFILKARQHFYHFFGERYMDDQEEAEISQLITVKGTNYKHHLTNPGLINNLYGIIEMCMLLGCSRDEIQRGIDECELSDGRGTMLTSQAGDIKIIDDTYNANPESLLMLARSMHLHKAKNKNQNLYTVLILGEMGEQGEPGRRYILDILSKCKELVDELHYVHGPEHLLADYADVLLGQGVFVYETVDDLKDVFSLDRLSKPVLIGCKASNAMRFDELVSWLSDV